MQSTVNSYCIKFAWWLTGLKLQTSVLVSYRSSNCATVHTTNDLLTMLYLDRPTQSIFDHSKELKLISTTAYLEQTHSDKSVCRYRGSFGMIKGPFGLPRCKVYIWHGSRPPNYLLTYIKQPISVQTKWSAAHRSGKCRPLRRVWMDP